MGTGTLRDRTCTIQYPVDTYLLLELADVMTSPVLLFLIAVGAYHTGRYIAQTIWPHCSRWAQSLMQKISVRVRPSRGRREPTVRPPARRERPAPNSRPSTPRNQPVDAPRALAILTPARDPPRALITALNEYQNQVAVEPETPRARARKLRY